MKRLLLGVFFVLAACAAPAPTAAPSAAADEAGEVATIFVTSNGWHTGIVLARADLPAGAVPEAADFPAARYLEFGWGDAEYYPADQPTVGMGLRAILAPTPAVMHLAGYETPPSRRYPGAEMVRLRLPVGGLQRLVTFIHQSFSRGDQARVQSTGPGLYAGSRFYPAEGRFHLFNTCNTWSARALAAAGVPMAEAAHATTAEDLMSRVRVLAKERGE